MDISLIVAVAENGIIGRDNDMPWKISSDLKRFRDLTMGKPLIMGRKTFDSIGRPLDGRANIVLTRNEGFSPDGVMVVHTLDEALAVGREQAELVGAEEVMVMGGAEIYRLCLPLAQRIYYSLVHCTPDGDASFPELDPDVWRVTAREDLPQGPKDSCSFSFLIYEKA